MRLSQSPLRSRFHKSLPIESASPNFFLQSGCAVWFLYFIIVTETLGATSLLFSRTLLAAAFALTLIMIGAITTHLHNRDPFSDSLEALHLLILLACIVLIRRLEKECGGAHTKRRWCIANNAPALTADRARSWSVPSGHYASGGVVNDTCFYASGYDRAQLTFEMIYFISVKYLNCKIIVAPRKEVG